jgi:hypothetical protein
VREGGLAEAGGAVEEEVVERLLALEGSLDRDPQVLLELVLADKLAQSPGTKSGVLGVLLVLYVARDDAFFGCREAPLSEYVCYQVSIIRAVGTRVYAEMAPECGRA